MFSVKPSTPERSLRVKDNSASQELPLQNAENVQEVSKQKRTDKKTKWPKTDARHWQGRLFKNSFTREGQKQETADWCVKIAHLGRRETFNLQTPNSGAAATRALKIYRTLIGAGWDAALLEHKPQGAPKQPKPALIGTWLEEVRATAGFVNSTFNTYAQCLRQIAAEIEDIGDQPLLDDDGTPKRDKKRKIITRSRFDHKTGGRAAWVEKVHALPLTVLSPTAIQRWKVQYIARAGDAPDARRKAENSAATLMRCSRSLFSVKVLKFASPELFLPNPLPFYNAELPKKGSTLYQSKIDAAEIISKARAELMGEPFKIFVLGITCGLRKREIDLLSWKQVDLVKAVIRIERTEHFSTKSEDSAGTIDLDAEVVTLLGAWKRESVGEFAINSTRKPRHHASRVNYRCEQHFQTLYSWLRKQGITASKPLHELRKELGALLASNEGIFAAKSVLRHAQISTTAAYYADKKRKITGGLGSHLGTKPEAATPAPAATPSKEGDR